MSPNSMSMGDRPSRRGRGAAADPVIEAVQKEDLVNLNIRVPAELRKRDEAPRHRGRCVDSRSGSSRR